MDKIKVIVDNNGDFVVVSEIAAISKHYYNKIIIYLKNGQEVSLRKEDVCEQFKEHFDI